MSGTFLFLISVTVSALDFVATHRKKLGTDRQLQLMMKVGVLYSVATVAHLLIVTFWHGNALLCKGCTDVVFGFPRVNVFAAEPLFWANALIPFFVVAMYSMVHKYSRLAAVSLFGISLAIGLTFARGAYLAIGAVLAVQMVYIARTKWSDLGSMKKVFAVSVFGFVVSWALLVGSAVSLHERAPYVAYNTLRGMLEHVSLGAVRMPVKTEVVAPVTTTVHPESIVESKQTANDEFMTKGLVKASETERTSSASYALQALRHDPRTTMFGVGLGNLGPFAHRYVSPLAQSDLTVYIFYVLLVSEMGVLGLAAVVYLFYRAIKNAIVSKQKYAQIVALVLVGFAAQYVFFGSYINVVYIWLWLGIGLGLGMEAGNGVELAYTKHEHNQKTAKSVH
jgi:hypothetical protein